MKYSALSAIAILEACKGVLALLVAIAIHALAGVNLHQATLNLMDQFHINSADHYSELVLTSVDKITHSGLIVVTVLTVGYAIIRFIEAYGLWHRLRWTEWFAFLSGAVYLPFEIYEAMKDFNFLSGGVLAINLVVVGYMYTVLKTRPEPKQLDALFVK